MWNIPYTDDLNHSGWTLQNKQQVLSNDGNPYNTYVPIVTGIKIFFTPNTSKVKRGPDGSHKEYNAEGIIPKYQVTSYTVNSHSMYLNHNTKGLYKVVAFNDYSDIPHMWTYHVYLKKEEIQ